MGLGLYLSNRFDMEQSIQVKIQYFHDALISQYESVELSLISEPKISESEKNSCKERMAILSQIINRHEGLFKEILHID